MWQDWMARRLAASIDPLTGTRVARRAAWPASPDVEDAAEVAAVPLPPAAQGKYGEMPRKRV